MYTRSYPSRKQSDSRLPPDYGGTALTLKQSDTEQKRQALTAQAPPSREHSVRPVSIFPEKEKESPPPIFVPPFGDLGQNGEGESTPDEAPEKESAAPESSASASARPVIDLSKIRTDDLLLLGIALMLFLDNEREDGVPLDALLILAVLFLSGL